MSSNSRISIDVPNFTQKIEDVDLVIQNFLKDMRNDVSHFFDLPEKSKFHKEFTQLRPKLDVALKNCKTFFHLGIGGSGLGTETIIRALSKNLHPEFVFFDNIDPDWIHQQLGNHDPKTTTVFVVTKSGGTFETLAQFAVIYEWLVKGLGSEAKARERLIFCTDPEKGSLRELSSEWKIPTFEIPQSLGGRFSVLCGLGLFPAETAGIDSHEILLGAKSQRSEFLKSCENKTHLNHEILRLASFLITEYKKSNRNITVLMPYSQKLKTLSAWFTQLWAESLGKNGLGITPVPAVGATDQHSILQLLGDGPNDKIVGFIEIQSFENSLSIQWSGPKSETLDLLQGQSVSSLISAEFRATREVLKKQKKPSFTITLPKLNAFHLGELLFSLELLTAISGYFLNINPFDQPGVEEGKVLTRNFLKNQ